MIVNFIAKKVEVCITWQFKHKVAVCGKLLWFALLIAFSKKGIEM
jgi:hypothetical protein